MARPRPVSFSIPALLLVVGALLAAACGAADPQEAGTPGSEEQAQADTTLASGAPDVETLAMSPSSSAPPLDDTNNPAVDEDSSTTGAEASTEVEPRGLDLGEAPIGQLRSALATSSGTDSYVLRQTISQTITNNQFGVAQSTVIDTGRPIVVLEVTPEVTRSTVDLSGLVGEIPGVDLTMIMWADDQRVVIDTTRLQSLVDLNPSSAGVLGPLEPGVSSVDVVELGVGSEADLATAMIGVGIPTLEGLATDLPLALSDLEVVDETTIRGTITVADFQRATGGNPELNANSTAAGVAANGGLDAADLAAFYLDLWERIDTTVEIEIRDGIVVAIRQEADMSLLWEELSSPGSPIPGGDPSMSEVEHTVKTEMTFEVDPDLEIEPAPEATEDRTAEWRAMLFELGSY